MVAPDIRLSWGERKTVSFNGDTVFLLPSLLIVMNMMP